MKYTVVWTPAAEDELASAWMAADDRAAVTLAVNTIDALLRFQPGSVGESRTGDARILIVPPLVATFRVVEADRMVRILAARLIPRRYTDER